MSHKVVTLVCSRTVGSASLKAVLVNMADKASDGGEGVFASKGTIAAETELSPATVKRAVRELMEMGLIVEAGQRTCTNGHTVVYDINVAAVAALPEWKRPRKSARTPVTVTPVHHEPGSQRPMTGVTMTPDPGHHDPLTILEPSLNKEKEKEARARAADPGAADPGLIGRLTHALGFDHHGQTPRYWISPDAALIAARWQTDLGLTTDEVLHVAVQNMRIHGTPANGPKTLNRHMQDFAAAKTAPRLEPTKGKAHEPDPDTAHHRPTYRSGASRAHDNLAAGFARAVSKFQG